MKTQRFAFLFLVLLIPAPALFGQFPEPPPGISSGRMEDIIRSVSESVSLNASTSSSQSSFSSPFIDAEKARSMSYDNDLKKVRTYYERKRKVAQWRDDYSREQMDRKQRNAAERKKREELRKRPPPTRLTINQLDNASGTVTWPVVLKHENFDKERQSIDDLYPEHVAAGGGINTFQYSPLQRTIKAMKEKLYEHKKNCEPEQDTHTVKFLTSFSYECKQEIN